MIEYVIWGIDPNCAIDRNIGLIEQPIMKDIYDKVKAQNAVKILQKRGFNCLRIQKLDMQNINLFKEAK